jgi:hypothetical protein
VNQFVEEEEEGEEKGLSSSRRSSRSDPQQQLTAPSTPLSPGGGSPLPPIDDHLANPESPRAVASGEAGEKGEEGSISARGGGGDDGVGGVGGVGGGVLALRKRRDDFNLPPGTLQVCNVFETSFEIRWEPIKQDRHFGTFRVTLFDHDRSVKDIVITTKKSWTFVGLDPSGTYGVAVTCRSMLLTFEGLPSEKICEFFLPDSTLMESVTLKGQHTELAYWFDGQPSSYFSPLTGKPFKLFLGTVQPLDGSFLQETKLGVVEMGVKYGQKGSPEEPGLAFTGISALELFAPYGLGVGTYCDFEVCEGRKSIYEG